MPDPIFRRQNSPELRMTRKPDAAQVVDFAFVPVRGRPDARYRRHFGEFAWFVALPARKHELEDETLARMRETGKMIDNFQVRVETGLRRFLGIDFQVIHAADAVQHVETQLRIVTQKPADGEQIGRIDNNERINGVELLGLDPVAELLLEGGDDFGGSHSQTAPRLAASLGGARQRLSPPPCCRSPLSATQVGTV